MAWRWPLTYLLVSGVLLLLLDQWSKRLVEVRMSDRALCIGPVQIRHVAHARQFFQLPISRVLMPLVWCGALACALSLHRWGTWFQSPLSLVGLGFAFGGAAGNLLDVFRRRYVIDFVDLGWWPVFNLADAGIVAGLALAFFR